MCHPTGFCGLVFASVVAHLRGVNAYAIDIRSHGYSERGDVTKWELFGNDLESAFAEISQRSGHKKVIGVGISSGSSAHILNAAKNPDFYRGLYLCEPILFPPGSDIDHREFLADSARRRRESFESRDEAYFNYSSGGGFSKLSSSALALYCTHGFENFEGGITLRCNKQDEEAIYLSGAANNVFESLSKIEVPTRIIYGEFSKTVNVTQANLYASQLNNATVEELRNTGHFTLFEKPYAGAMSIRNFLDSFDTEPLGS